MTLSELDRLARSALLGCAVLAALPAVVMASATYSTEQDVNPQTGNWRVCVMQDNGANQVAGVQMELSWDPGCMSSASASGKPKCESNPDTGKTVQSAMKGGSMLKAIFLSFSDVEPIPDGWLFCCDFSLADKNNKSGCTVSVGNVIGSTSQGQRIPVQAAAPPSGSGSSGSNNHNNNRNDNYNNNNNNSGGGDSGGAYDSGSGGSDSGAGSNSGGQVAANNGSAGGTTTGNSNAGGGAIGGGAAGSAGTGSQANAGTGTGSQANAGAGGDQAGEAAQGTADGGTAEAAGAAGAQGGAVQTMTPAAATSTPKPAATSTPKPVATPTRAAEPTETPAKSGGLGGCQLNR